MLCLCLITPAAVAQADSAKKTVLNVTNLTCNGDMPTIRKALLNQDGIESVTFTPRVAGASTFTIMYLGQVISPEQIRKAIESTPGCDDKSTTPYRVKKDKTGKTKQS